MTLYLHWRDIPKGVWRWPNFSPAEIACRGTGKILLNEQALTKLQKLRDTLGKPMVITSGYRSPEHNKRVGGATASRHLQGDAFDVTMANHDPHAFIAAAKAAGFTGIGSYPASGFTHIDTGASRSWGTPWPATAREFPPEPKPLTALFDAIRELLKDFEKSN